MAQRLVRGKRKIHESGIPYRVPPVELLAERTDAVLGVAPIVFEFRSETRARFVKSISATSDHDEST